MLDVLTFPSDWLTIPNMTLGRARILAVLRAHANGDRQCWPSQERIALLAKLCERHVRRELARLEQLGWITRERLRRYTRYTIDALFFAKVRTKRPRTPGPREAGTRESLSSPTESVAAREGEIQSRNDSRAPLETGPHWHPGLGAHHDRKRAMGGWLAKLGQYVGQFETAHVVTFWHAVDALQGAGMTPEIKGYLNQIDSRMRASSWHRQHEIAVRRYWMSGGALCATERAQGRAGIGPHREPYQLGQAQIQPALVGDSTPERVAELDAQLAAQPRPRRSSVLPQHSGAELMAALERRT